MPIKYNGKEKFMDLLKSKKIIQSYIWEVYSKDLDKNDEREDYIRAKLSFLKNNEIVAEPFPKQDSSMTKILANSQGLIIRKRFATAIKAGSKVLVIPFVHINQSL